MAINNTDITIAKPGLIALDKMFQMNQAHVKAILFSPIYSRKIIISLERLQYSPVREIYEMVFIMIKKYLNDMKNNDDIFTNENAFS